MSTEKSKWLDDAIKGFFETLTLCCVPCIVVKHCLCCDKNISSDNLVWYK